MQVQRDALSQIWRYIQRLTFYHTSHFRSMLSLSSWPSGPVVMAKLLYVEPGEYWEGWPFANIPSKYATCHSGQLSLIRSVGREMSTGHWALAVLGSREGNRGSGHASQTLVVYLPPGSKTYGRELSIPTTFL